ncbi:MAG: MarR family winged helix-turn-helix transcriptional regulator [bacterium]
MRPLPAGKPTSAGDGSSAGASAVPRCLNAVRSLVRAIHANSRAIEANIGLGLAQVFVLQELEKRPASSLNELAARTATHQSSVSAVVKRLSDRGLVFRSADPVDRRRLRIVLTPAGQAMLAMAPATIQSRLLRGLARLEPSVQIRLAELLDEWLAGAGVDMGTPPMLLETESQAVGDGPGTREL